MRKNKSGLLLWRKHLSKNRQHFGLSLTSDLSELSDQSRFIHRSDLIKHDLSLLAFELASYSGRVRRSSGRHGCDDHCVCVAIHFVGRDNRAGPGFLNLAADGRVQVDEKNIESFDYHSHSSSSQLL